MNMKSEVAHRASRELIAITHALGRAVAFFWVIRQALAEEECSQRDVLALLDVGAEICGTYAERAAGEAVSFEEAASREPHADDSSQGVK